MGVVRISRLLLLAAAPFFLASCGHAQEGSSDAQELVFELSSPVKLARVVGANEPGEDVPSPNNTAEAYDVCGTDLGIVWEMASGGYGLLFGDTFGKGFVPGGGGGNGGNWRSNVLAFSSDTCLDDGLSIDGMALDASGKASEFIPGVKARPVPYQTTIPTSAISVEGKDYVHVMNIHTWGSDGRWLINWAAFYASSDGGKTWERVVTFSKDSHFGQVALAIKDEWVYMMGTWCGRSDSARLARIPASRMEDPSAYQYWTGSTWAVGDETKAAPVIPAPVGEASLIWLEKYGRWLLTYTYEPWREASPLIPRQAILYKTTTDITSWPSERGVLVDGGEFEIPYGGFIHPLSASSDTLYFMLSQWNPYCVYLMSASMHL